jgi:outer membrane receptor protein involved in Fe transport
MKKASALLALSAVLSLGSANLFGQAETGQIAGSVLDASGGVVGNAAVKITNVATAAIRETTTSSSGLFNVANLEPADYSVTVTAPGFTTYESKVTLAVGTKVGLDVKLQVGQTGTVVEVTETAVTVNTETQTIQQNLTTKDILELPTLSRDPYSLVVTSGNVSEDDPSGRGAGVAINGLRSASTNIMLDGVSNNDEFTASVGQQVPLDSVQEIGIVTNNFTAEVGRASAGVINVTTKSGTNAFHGTAYEFNRVSDLASNSFENDADGVAKSTYVFNQFGESIGGPVKKNKLFFFNNTEWTRIRSAANEQAYIPDPALIAASAPSTQSVFSAYGKLAPGVSTLGVFSRNQLAAQGNDPCSNASAGCLTYNPNAPMFDLVNYNVPANAGAGSPQNTYDSVSKVDYNLSEKTTIWARYAIYSENDFAGSVVNSPYAGYNTGQTTLDNAIAVSLVHVFNPNFVSQTKLDFNRLNVDQPLSTAGVVPTYFLGASNSATTIGNFDVALPGYGPYSPGNALPFGGPQNIGEMYQDFSANVGKHSIRFGGKQDYIRDNRSFGAYEEANNILGVSIGEGLDNFIAGQVHEFSAAIYPQGEYPCVNGVQTPACTITLPVGPPNFSRSNRYEESALYVQDTWKISKRLTLNLGVRWEYFGAQHNSNKNLDSNFYYPNNVQPQNPLFIQNVEQGGVTTAPASSVGALWSPKWTNFGPRVGIAWDVFGDGKTAFRGGYGIGYERNFGNVTYNVLFNPPNYAVVDLVAGSNIASIPISASNAGPLSGSSGSAALPPSELRAVEPNIPQAYAHLISASIERALFGTHKLEVDYSASIGVNQYDINPVNFPGTGNYYGGIACTPGDTLTGGPNPCAAPLNTQYSAVNLRGAGGSSSYNSLNVRYDIAQFQGVTLRANYTYSHAIDDLSDAFSSSYNQFNLGYTDFQNPSVDKGSSEYDNRHRVALFAIWEIPFARHLHGVARSVLGGWELAPVFTARTGAPFNVYDLSGTYAIYTRVVTDAAVPGPTRIASGTDNYTLYTFGAGGIPTSTYINPKTGDSDFGPFPANMTGRDSFRAPGSLDLDMGIYKSIKFSETMSLQLRMEAFNALNHANFGVNVGAAYIGGGTPGGVGGSGTITGLYNGNRNLQLGAKFIF